MISSFSVILYWLFVPNCLLHFALNENVLLAKLVLLLTCGNVALGHFMGFGQNLTILSVSTFSFQSVFGHFMFLRFWATVLLKPRI